MQPTLAITAVLDQQREIIRYMRSLNEWIGRESQDRTTEMNRVIGSLDAVRQIMDKNETRPSFTKPEPTGA